jgi:hypothetical protein
MSRVFGSFPRAPFINMALYKKPLIATPFAFRAPRRLPPAWSAPAAQRPRPARFHAPRDGSSAASLIASLFRRASGTPMSAGFARAIDNASDASA